MKPTQMNLSLIVAVLALPIAAVGQNADASSTGVTEDEVIEETIVFGEKSLTKLRKEVWGYEEDFYSLYNKLNDDNEYDVRCFYETPTGSRIKNHVCRAKFISNAYSSSQSRMRANADRRTRMEDDPEIAEKTAKFQAKLESLIAANPDLQAALSKYNTARARFMAELSASANN